MKKSLSILLAALMLLTSFAFTVNAQDEATGPIVFTLVDGEGKINSGKGRNGECYFPQSSSEVNPELYTWGSASMTSADGYAVFVPKDAAGMMEFDTFPSSMAWKGNKKHTFLVLAVKAEKAGKASVGVVAQGAKYKKNFDLDFTGAWQQIIVDLNDATGWYIKNSGGGYDLVNYSPMNYNGNQVMTGGFRLDMPPKSITGNITIDYIGLFGSADEAKAYKGRQTPESSVVYTGTVEMPEIKEDTTSTPVVDEGSAELGKAVIFTLTEESGAIEHAKGRNGDCFFPQGSSETNPEIYTWGSGVIGADEGYATLYPGSGTTIMEFDTFPKDKAWSADKKLSYLAFVVKAASAADTSINVVSQGNKFLKSFNIKFTGDWQLVVIDLNNATGWTMKNAEGKYDPITYSPIKNPEGNQVMTSGFRLDFKGNSVIASYKFDYIGLFESIASAKAYKNRQTPKTVDVVNGAVAASSGTSTGGTTGGTAAKPEEPAEPEKPKMKDALTRGEEEKVDNSITLESAVPASVIDDTKRVYKFVNLGEYDDAGKRWNILDDEGTSYLQTWGMGSFEATTAGVLKFKSNASGGTLFESHTKKGPDSAKHIYMVLGYKTNEDFSAKNNTAYLYSSGNSLRLPFIVNIDSEWHYDLYDLTKLDAYTKDSNYATKAESRSGMSLGAFRIDFPKAEGIEFYIDYIGFFADEAEAKEYIAKSEKAAGLDKEKAPVEEEKFTYMKGYDDGTFRPGAQMTRAEAATVVARLLADEETISAERDTKFTDVKKGDWYYNYVTYLEELGYLPNYSGEFKPNQNITRGEFIKLAFEAGGLEFSMKRPKYVDLDKNHPYYKEIVFASGTGIVTGYDNGDGTMSFKPDGQITRAEIATVVNRILKIEATPDAAQEFSDLDNKHWAYGIVMAIASKK